MESPQHKPSNWWFPLRSFRGDSHIWPTHCTSKIWICELKRKRLHRPQEKQLRAAPAVQPTPLWALARETKISSCCLISCLAGIRSGILLAQAEAGRGHAGGLPHGARPKASLPAPNTPLTGGLPKVLMTQAVGGASPMHPRPPLQQKYQQRARVAIEVCPEW